MRWMDSATVDQTRKSAAQNGGVKKRGFAKAGKRFLQQLNPLAPVSSQATDDYAATRTGLGRAPARPWGTINRWTSDRPSSPNAVTHESQLTLVSFNTSKAK